MGERVRVILVTGTSSGFGEAVSRALAAQGHIVYGATRNPVADPCKGVRPLRLDVTSEDSVSAGVAEVIRSSGRIDVVLNNAGIGIAGALEDTTPLEASEQLNTNLMGTHRVCRAVLSHMRAQGGGHIINMSSLAGLVALPFQGFYSVSKFGIEAYSEALRMEVRPYGIAVSMIEPGDFATRFTFNRRMTAASTMESPYHERCRRAIEQMAKDEQSNADLSPIVQAVTRIIADPRPALHYPRGMLLQRFLVALRPFVPQALFEKLIVDMYKIA